MPAAEQNISTQQVSMSATSTLLNMRWSILEAAELPASVPATLPACGTADLPQRQLRRRGRPRQRATPSPGRRRARRWSGAGLTTQMAYSGASLVRSTPMAM